MKKSLLLFCGLFGGLLFSQQKTYCNPINIDYGYTPFDVFSKQGKHRATEDPVIVNFKKSCFFFPQTRKAIGTVMIC